jgi:hypothetical protein
MSKYDASRMRDYEAESLFADCDIMGRPTQLRRKITCPFCGTKVVAYVWSLSGSGKKCPGCLALHCSFTTIPLCKDASGTP